MLKNRRAVKCNSHVHPQKKTSDTQRETIEIIERHHSEPAVGIHDHLGHLASPNPLRLPPESFGACIFVSQPVTFQSVSGTFKNSAQVGLTRLSNFTSSLSNAVSTPRKWCSTLIRCSTRTWSYCINLQFDLHWRHKVTKK